MSFVELDLRRLDPAEAPRRSDVAAAAEAESVRVRGPVPALDLHAADERGERGRAARVRGQSWLWLCAHLDHPGGLEGVDSLRREAEDATKDLVVVLTEGRAD